MQAIRSDCLKIPCVEDIKRVFGHYVQSITPKADITPNDYTYNNLSCQYPIAEQKVNQTHSVELTFIKRYNWLLHINLIPVDIETMSQKNIKTYLNNLNRLYHTDSSGLFALFFQYKCLSPFLKYSWIIYIVF